MMHRSPVYFQSVQLWEAYYPLDWNTRAYVQRLMLKYSGLLKNRPRFLVQELCFGMQFDAYRVTAERDGQIGRVFHACHKEIAIKFHARCVII
jgi:hypothetical protein